MSKEDIFISNKVYPNASDIFSVSVTPLQSIKDNCLFILDTNALLLPYTTSSKSIDELKKVYSKLISEKRLKIPGQVAREFAKNRPEKIKELFQQLNRKRDKVKTLYSGQYPLLTHMQEYNESIIQEKQIDELIKEYSKKIGEVVAQIKNWTWNDPVSLLYSSLFSGEAIEDLKLNEEEIRNELERRYLHKIPPGFKDEGKVDDGIGDLLIWYTILEVAKRDMKDVIFVSGEEKTDWFYKSEGQTLYPRFELISEFREKTNNKSFQIIKLFEMLELFGADKQVVKELEIEEKQSRNAVPLFNEREKIVLKMICDGKTTKEMAEELNLSIRTIEWHRINLLKKTQSTTISGLVLFAVRHNIFDPAE
jgi:DNA-binding CsgD family transcriptional regulator